MDECDIKNGKLNDIEQQGKVAAIGSFYSEQQYLNKLLKKKNTGDRGRKSTIMEDLRVNRKKRNNPRNSFKTRISVREAAVGHSSFVT